MSWEWSDHTRIEEPALALTPGKGQGRSADGWLTATEIAALKLNADWVLLSACNTAGVTTGASTLYKENVAGLTWPFFQAGALSLLVSHWPALRKTVIRARDPLF